MHACVWLPACMSTHVCGAWESTFAMFLRCHPAWFLRKGLSLTWSSWITLGWFVNLGPACGPLSIGRIINMNKHVQTLIIIVYKVGSGKSNSGPHACNANALETESSPQFWIFSRLQFVTMISKFYFFSHDFSSQADSIPPWSYIFDGASLCLFFVWMLILRFEPRSL